MLWVDFSFYQYVLLYFYPYLGFWSSICPIMIIYISFPISGQLFISIKSIQMISVFIQIAISVSFNKEDQSIYTYWELLIYLELFLLLVFYLSSLCLLYLFIYFIKLSCFLLNLSSIQYSLSPHFWFGIYTLYVYYISYL